MLFLLPYAIGVAATEDSACTSRYYRVLSLPLLPVGINEQHQVAGTAASHRASLWSADAGLRELPLPPGFVNSAAVAINRAGHVLLVASDRAFQNQKSFLYAGDRPEPLTGVQARGFGINDSDSIVGEAIAPDNRTVEPVIWKKGVRHSVENCCGGTVKAINNPGDVIGDAYDRNGRYQGFQRIGDAPIRVLTPNGAFSAAVAINDKGHVVVQAGRRVYLYDDGAATALALAPRFPSQARAISDCDAIVGSFGPFSDAARAFVWEPKSGFRDLNDLIPADSGWKLESAVGINNQGEIVGVGDRAGRDDQGFLLVPEP